MSFRSPRNLIRILILLGVVAALGMRVQTLLARAAAEPQARDTAHRSVRAVAVERGTIRAWAFGDGTARAVRREYLSFQSQGKVAFVKKDTDGDEIREGSRVLGPHADNERGDLLARLDDREAQEELRVSLASQSEAEQRVLASQAQREQYEADLVFAEAEYRRAKELFEASAGSQARLDEAAARKGMTEASIRAAEADIEASVAGVATAIARVVQARVSLEYSEIRAPFDGVVAYMNTKEGYHFSPSNISANSEDDVLRTVPIVMIDDSEFEVTLEVPVFDGRRVAVGQLATIGLGEELAAHERRGVKSPPPRRVEGVVHSVTPAVSPGGRSIQVKVRLPGEGSGLRDGSYVSCWITTEEKADALTVPMNAVVYRDNLPYAFIVDPKTSIVQERQVELGIQGLDDMEIISGASVGELVVTEGRHHMVNGATVHVVIDGKAEEGE